MSNKHYMLLVLVIATLTSCTHTVIERPTCYVNADPERITAECQAQINALATQQLNELNNIQQRKSNGALWRGLLVVLLIVACGFAVLHGYKMFRKTTLETDKQLMAAKQQQAHERELAKIAATRDAAIAAAQSAQPLHMPHTLHITDSHNTTTHTTTTDSRRITHKEAKPLKADLLSLPKPTIENCESRQLPAPPTLAEAMQHPSHLVIGRDEAGELVLADFEEARSVGFGGMMGAGKTTAMLWLAVQLIAKLGSNVIAFDPHSKAAQGGSFSQRVAPFAPFFLHEPCGLSETARGVQYINAMIRNKLDGVDPDPLPFLVLMDELQALMASQYREDIQNLGRQTTDEVRKVNGYGFYALHRPYVQDIGQMGHSIQSHLVCRTNRRLAAAQTHLPISHIPQNMEALPQGVALWKSQVSPEARVLSYPHIKEDDIKNVLQKLQPQHISKPVIDVSPTPPTHPRHDDIVELIRQGMSNTKIIESIFSSSGGNAFSRHMEAVKTIRANL